MPRQIDKHPYSHSFSRQALLGAEQITRTLSNSPNGCGATLGTPPPEQALLGAEQITGTLLNSPDRNSRGGLTETDVAPHPRTRAPGQNSQLTSQ